MSETILNRPVGEQFKDDYTRYALYTTYKRVLSDFRDGLKPVQRRILYAMFNDTKAINHTVKSAAVVGDVMKLYHPHGNCLDGNTMIYSLDHSVIRIEDAYNLGIKSINVLSVDKDGNIVPAVASNFRIGTYTDKEYHIHLTNGYVLSVTEEHPIMTGDGTWVYAKDIRPGCKLFTDRIKFATNGRPCVGDEYIHTLVYDYYYGKPPIGYERHHKDFNYLNNNPENFECLEKYDHVNIHKGSDSSIEGLSKGRYSMFSENGKDRDRTRKKNSILAQEFNKDQGIRRFKSVINMMRNEGIEITESNYESYRDKVYNLPIISRLIERHPEYNCKTFEDLVNYNPASLSDLFNQRRNELKEFDINQNDIYSPMKFFDEERGAIYRKFSNMLSNNIPLTVENYIATTDSWRRNSVDIEKVRFLIDLYKLEKPYVDYIEIVSVKNKPMYDFTVEGTENMLIPVKTEMNDYISSSIGFNIPLICVHNSGIYGTFKPMTNWWEGKVPLLDKQGNFGTLSGDIESAERYTEVKLSKFAMECVIGELANTRKSVDWVDNYSNTCLEPEFLPVKVPLLLIEGSLGIGVGLRADIPAHNLAEVIDATLYLMHNPEGQVALVPDHCMDCEIYDTDWSKISKAGFGHYKIRGKIDIEDYKNKKALVIKSLPDMTFLNTIKEKIEELVEKKKIIQIENIYDECTVDKMRLVIVLKNGADPNFVRDVIYKNTKVEQTLRINFETLYGFNPLRMSYKSYLLSFIDFRKQTKFRLYANMLQDVQTRIHERDAYIKVLESGEIDNIIAMIRKQKKADDSYLIDYLMKRLKITDLQAKYIINTDLRRLSIGYLNKYKEEALALEKQRKAYMAVILDEKRIEAEIEQELLDIKARYGKPRTCRIIKGVDDQDIPKGMMQIAVTEKNYVKKVPDGTSIGSFRNDSVRTMIHLDNTDSIIIFDEQGRVFKLPVHKIPFTDRNSNGTDVRYLMKGLTANINCIIPESVIKELAKKGSHNNKHYLITITRNGLYKRMDLDDFTTVPPSGILYAKLEPNDYVKDIIIAHSNFNLIVYSDKKAVSVNVNDIPYLKRNTKGSRAIYNAETVDGLCVIDQTKSDIVVITELGKINRLPTMSLPINPNKKGFNVIKLSATDKIHSILSGNDSNIICIKTLKSYYEIPIAQLAIGSSIGGGEKLVPMKADQMIRCWIK